VYLIALSACGKKADIELGERAKSWDNLLRSLDTKERDAAIKEIEEFIEPSPGRT